ncbi:MAG: hypothetical protein P8Y53_11740 [Pseudolabrys sp.]
MSAPASADGWRCETLTTWGRVRHARTSALAACYRAGATAFWPSKAIRPR